MHDLLYDELIGVRTPHGLRRLSLPALLAALSRGEVDGYTGLRAHQADPWHVFLVQLAASIQARYPVDQPPDDESYWRTGLLDLADGQRSAWSLFVEDVTLPAFFQHPWASWDADSDQYDLMASTPDELDVLITSKNHDVKKSRIGAEAVEAWIFALMTLQTTTGYLGSGRYGIVRMNSGNGSRSIVSWVRDLHPSKRFQEELIVVNSLRQETISKLGYRDRGTVLTWLTHWQRDDHQHMLGDLEPWFIEAARPLRVRCAKNGQLVVLRAVSRNRQIGPKKPDGGDVGDPWTPIHLNGKKERAALTVSEKSGYLGVEQLTALLFEQGFELTPLQRPRLQPGAGWFTVSVLVREEGKTRGFHRLALPVPAKACRVLCPGPVRDALAEFAQRLINDAKDVTVALRTALTVLAEGGPDKGDFDRDAIKRWIDALQRQFKTQWEARFFPTLWQATETAPEDATAQTFLESCEPVRLAWQHGLVADAEQLWRAGTYRIPLPSNRRWRAVANSRGAFIGILHSRKVSLPTTSAVSREETLA